MSSEFYWKGGKHAPVKGGRSNPQAYIGLQSGAGLYCWDCRRSLFRGNIENLHKGAKTDAERDAQWYDACPECGREAPARLPRTIPRSGIDTCCSFTWHQDPETVMEWCRKYPDEVIIDGTVLWMTGRQFLETLGEVCPIQYLASKELFGPLVPIVAGAAE